MDKGILLYLSLSIVVEIDSYASGSFPYIVRQFYRYKYAPVGKNNKSLCDAVSFCYMNENATERIKSFINIPQHLVNLPKDQFEFNIKSTV